MYHNMNRCILCTLARFFHAGSHMVCSPKSNHNYLRKFPRTKFFWKFLPYIGQFFSEHFYPRMKIFLSYVWDKTNFIWVIHFCTRTNFCPRTKILHHRTKILYHRTKILYHRTKIFWKFYSRTIFSSTKFCNRIHASPRKVCNEIKEN